MHPLGRGCQEAMDGLWREAVRVAREWGARGCDGAQGFGWWICVAAGGAAKDLVLERAEALQAAGDAFQDERGVGRAKGADEVGEVGGFGALLE
jgi:hypothetical protein